MHSLADTENISGGIHNKPLRLIACRENNVGAGGKIYTRYLHPTLEVSTLVNYLFLIGISWMQSFCYSVNVY